MIWPYALVFLAATAVDSIPVFAPPAWTVLVFLLIKFDLDPWLVVVLGVSGTTAGRFILTTYIPWIGSKILNKKEDENLGFLGKKLSRKPKSTFVFVLLYSLTPLSTTALFTASGIAKVSRWRVLPPFFVGKLISYGVLIFTGQYAFQNIGSVLHGALSLKGIATAVAGLVVLLGFLFLDWRVLLEEKKLSFNFRIWK
jgi:membrane protein YqaA with SNARE-associated domain